MNTSPTSAGDPWTDLQRMLKEGAQVIDVRTPQEYMGGHVEGSINIPLDRIGAELARFDKDKPVVTCCRSGARSEMAAEILSDAGFMAVNGGPWQVVERLKG